MNQYTLWVVKISVEISLLIVDNNYLQQEMVMKERNGYRD